MAWTRDRPCPEYVRAKISATLTGRKHPPDVIARRAAANSRVQKGKSRKPLSKEHREKIGAGSKKHWREHREAHMAAADKIRGRSLTEATKSKMRRAALGRIISDQQRAGISARQIGRTLSEETKAKMRAAQRLRYYKNPSLRRRLSESIKAAKAKK